MGYGGYAPYPRRFGGSGGSSLEAVHASLNQQRGTAYDTSVGTIVWLENMAFARAIVFDGWEVNKRLSYQWDPERMTDNLARWEAICALPQADLSDWERRQRTTARWQMFGKLANHTRLTDELRKACGDFFVAVEYISPAVANVHVPDASYPWGTVVPGITWYSTVSHILVRMQKPAGATEGQFYAAAGKVAPTLDPIVPIWCTYDWYRPSTCGPSDSVPGGPSAQNFYLDCPNNLDNALLGS